MAESIPNSSTESGRDEEVEMVVLHESLLEKIRLELGLEGEQAQLLRQNFLRLEASLRDFDDELKRSEAVNENDLAIRINVRDYD